MKEKAKSLIVLDHHKSAAEDLNGLDFCVFDMKKSGAHVVWDYFFKGKEPPWLVQYTEDRDLYAWELPHSREVNAALSGYPFDFQTWDNLDRMISLNDLYSSHCEFVQDGAAICRFQNLQVENIIKNAREMKLDDYKIMAANTSVGFSDVAGRLARDCLFGVAWYLREDGKYVYSLRSENRKFDVSKLATKFNGGGHFSSAGFSSDKFVLVG
jgi:oligoribonuclease NrnB/cAMP/cGMP phosphodiesterase (DHH superfamily)